MSPSKSRHPSWAHAAAAAILTTVVALTGSGLASEAAAETVVIEEAWIVPSADSNAPSSAYLVINNRTALDVVVKAVTSPQIDSARLLRPSGEELTGGATIPSRAELYMMPGGVRLELGKTKSALAPGVSVPLVVQLQDNRTAKVDALVLEPAATPPDHHDYVH